MDTSVLGFVLAVSGSIIILLLTIVGYFVKKLINKVDDISVSLVNICLTVEKSSVSYDSFEEICERNFNSIDHRLNGHEKRINEHESRLVKLEK
jgi:hypothetical protein